MKINIFVLLLLMILGLSSCVSVPENPVEDNHIHTECKICGKCTDVDCPGTVEEKCQGCLDTQYHEMCEICGKCYDPDCGWLEKYRCKDEHVKKAKGLFVTSSDTIMHSVHENSYYELKTYEEYIDFMEFYDMQKLTFINKDKDIYEYSIDFINDYDESFFETKSLCVFSFPGKYDFRDGVCYVGRCYYYKTELRVWWVSPTESYGWHRHECAICSFVEIEKIVFPYIKSVIFEPCTEKS